MRLITTSCSPVHTIKSSCNHFLFFFTRLILISLLLATKKHQFPLPVSSFASVCATTEPSRVSRRSKLLTMSDASVDHDVRDFHQYAASAVDLTHVSSVEDAQGTTTVFVTAIRSSRQWDPPLDQQRRQSHLYRFSLNATTTQPLQNLPPIPLDASIQIYLPSPSGKKTVVVTTTTTTTAEKKDKTSTLQVWEGAVLISCIVLKTHGTIIHDPTGFGTPVWSPDETHLLYNAERLPEPAEAFWKMTAADDDDKNDSNKIPAHRRRGGQFVLGIGQREHWGERYSTLEPILDLFLLNLQSGRIAKVDNVPTCYPGRDDTSGDDETITLGQAVWHPSGNKIAFTGWDAGLPKRLGMVYCRNRFSKVFEASVENLLKKLQADDDESKDGSDDEAFRCLTNDLPYARSPRYVSMESGDPALVFLGNHRQFVSHDAAMGLWHVTRKGEIDNIVPIIDMPLKEGPSVLGIGFPGLFLGQLPINCDMGESNNYLIANTLFGSVQRIIRVDVSSGNVDLIHIPELNELSSQAMCALAPSGDMVLSAVSCVSPASLWIVPAAGLQEKSTNGRLILHAQNVASFGPIACSTFAPVSKTTTFPFDMQILSIDPPEIEGTTAEPIQAILLLPKDVPQGEKVPLVVVPHGGPHSCTMSTFVPGFAHLASKYAVLFPNYRGSIGFGQAPMDSLLTRIGHVDVEDVMACTRHVIEKFSTIDGNRVGICGGSHGGFLTAHCTTQYPDFFKAAACRNPVTNIATMFTATDIPDWCLAEVMGECDLSTFRGPTQDQILKMYEKSPVSRIDHVKTPTLVALGKVDLRVPFSQGLEWYHSLKARGVPTKLLMYPLDNHALDRDMTEADHWIHIRQWFDKHL